MSNKGGDSIHYSNFDPNFPAEKSKPPVTQVVGDAMNYL